MRFHDSSLERLGQIPMYNFRSISETFLPFYVHVKLCLICDVGFMNEHTILKVYNTANSEGL